MDGLTAPLRAAVAPANQVPSRSTVTPAIQTAPKHTSLVRPSSVPLVQRCGTRACDCASEDDRHVLPLALARRSNTTVSRVSLTPSGVTGTRQYLYSGSAQAQLMTNGPVLPISQPGDQSERDAEGMARCVLATP